MMSQTIQARVVTDGSGVNGLKSDAWKTIAKNEENIVGNKP